MPTLAATHSGPFHADDVLAWALIKTFYDADATLLRSRDPDALQKADIVFDVGGTFDPKIRRFDHHQHDYTGPLSSAGMVLGWLQEQAHIDDDLAELLRERLVNYVDAVDNGRQTPDPTIPCFPQIVGTLNSGCIELADFDDSFLCAGEVARQFVEGIASGLREQKAGAAAVVDAMDVAAAAGSNLLFLDRYHRWKHTYFEHGGVEHPTEFVVHPGVDGRWRAVAVPPIPGSFAQKRPFPESWAGLRDGALAAVTGAAGARFCHKNRFIAVFDTRAETLEAMARFGLIVGPLPDQNQ
ncbi:MAG: uncharacterized UPF0160 family protein [Myxococcota bacterium]|jgi:uncharacterized UPF0160 family protein